MKVTHWAGVIASSLLTTIATTGCGDPAPAAQPMTGGSGGSAAGAPATGGAGSPATGGAGSPATGGGGAAGGATGIQLMGSAAHTLLTGDNALAGTAAPAKYSTTCGPCHGANAQGTMLIAPEIRHTPTAYATWVVRNGRKGTGTGLSMPAYTPTGMPASSITDAELTEVLTWLNSLPKPTTGQGLYQDFCGNCHGPMNGKGGAVPVSAEGKSKALVAMKVSMGSLEKDPAMRARHMPAITLTQTELDAISTFLMSTP